MFPGGAVGENAGGGVVGGAGGLVVGDGRVGRGGGGERDVVGVVRRDVVVGGVERGAEVGDGPSRQDVGEVALEAAVLGVGKHPAGMHGEVVVTFAELGAEIGVGVEMDELRCRDEVAQTGVGGEVIEVG